MIAYFKIKKAMTMLQEYLCRNYFNCAVIDANAVFFKPEKCYICIKIEYDNQKEKLKNPVELLSKFREFLFDVGISKSIASNLDLHIESKETVFRDFDGNWFYALFK